MSTQPPQQPNQPQRQHDMGQLREYVRRMLDKGMPPKVLHKKLVEKHQIPPQQTHAVIKQTLAQMEDEQELEELAEDLFDQGKSPKTVHRILVEKEGLSDEIAHRIVQKLKPKKKKSKGKSKRKNDLTADDNSRSAFTNMAIGGGICVLGLVVTIVSFASAASGGGRYVVAWGAVVFGAVQFFRGLIQLFR